ncbi:methyl-accepting chemotaxis protein [Actinoplanes sp. NPDC051859]|uniref:methyl-accepting chemotaxis protein n=1 Tax=Actinoplanes sp. NPDC051859 TaxID=3363909 RepID=UPI00378B04D4
MFRLPVLLDLNGQAIDETRLAATGPPAAAETARLHLARSAGAMASTQTAVAAGLSTAFAKTGRDELQRAQTQVQAEEQAVGEVITRLDEAVASGDLTAVTAENSERAAASLIQLAETLVPQLDALLDTRIEAFQAKAHVVEAAALIVVLLVGYLLIGFYRSATVPLRRIVDALRALAEGDLTRRVPVDTRDEVGQMGAALNDALARLREAMHALRGDADGLAGASTRLSTVSGEMHISAESTAARAGQVNLTADDVSTHVEAVAAGAEQMFASIQEISSSAGQAAGMATGAVDAVTTMQETVGRLGTRSTQIGDVVKVITGIAAQTNLLALNATIEAVRAGDAGRGFAVVAGEVKNLAQETSLATQNIIARIDAIQTDASATVRAIDDIETTIAQITDLQATIASAVEEQTATTREMSHGISRVAEGTRGIAAGVGHLTDEARQTTTGAVSTAHAAGELSSTAERLRTITAQFTT